MKNSRTLKYYQSYFNGNSSHLSTEAFMIALQAFKSELQKKGQHFNAIFLVKSFSEYVDDETFTHFFRRLKNYQPKEIERFQVIYFYQGHYSVLDIELKTDFIHVYCLDAASCLRAIPPLFILAKILPHANISWSLGSIQIDHENCAYFALYLAHHLSKIPNLHSELKNISHPHTSKYQKKLEEQLQTLPDDILAQFKEEEIHNIVSHINKVDYQNLPPSYGGLFKYMQNVSFFDKNLQAFGAFPLKKNITLHDFIHAHSEKITVYRQASNAHSFAIKEIHCNHAIELKRNKIHREARAYIKAMGRDTLFSTLPKHADLFNEKQKAHGLITDVLKLAYSLCHFELWMFLCILIFVTMQINIQEDGGFHLRPRT